MANGEWRPVRGWEEYYVVSDQGQFKALTRITRYRTGAVRTYPETIREGSIGHNGYRVFSLNAPGIMEFRYLHRMAAEAFIPNPDNLPLVRHLDDDKLNNLVDNLAWGTDSDNHWDAIRNGKEYWTQQTHCVNHHEYTLENTGMSKGARKCRQCERDRTARYRSKKREKWATSPRTA